jgi:circadian clock protein KaiC
VTGAPGTGKTVLASQICFHTVARGGRALYVTLFSELHANLIANLQAFTFFDPGQVSRALKLVSAGRDLAEAGPEGVLTTIRNMLHEERPTVLVIDGFRAVEQGVWSPTKLTMFVQELQALATLMGTTGLLLTCAGDAQATQEQALVEGLIDLENQAIDLRAVRTLAVRKFRGGNHLPGRHVFRIDGSGVHVSPRLESSQSPEPRPFERTDPSEERVHFGVAGLDRALGDGLAVGSTTLLLGPAGSGKTLLGLHLLAEGARRGERGLHFGFFETPPTLLQRARGFSLPLQPALDQGLLEVVWQPASEQTPDELADKLLGILRVRPARRLFIDGAVGFQQVSVYPGRLGRFYAALARELCNLGVTTVVTEETRQLLSRNIKVPAEAVSPAWQNIVLLRSIEGRSELKRTVMVLKTRAAAHDTGLYEFTIDGHGFVMGQRYGLSSHVSHDGHLMRGRD